MCSYFVGIDIAKSIHLTKLTNILHDNSHGRYSKNHAITLKELAKTSVGINNPTLSLQIKHAILQIELFDKQIKEVESLYQEILNEMNTPILTIPGMSYNQAAVILVILIVLNTHVNYLLMLV